MNTQSYRDTFTTAVVRYTSGTWGVVPADSAARGEAAGRMRVRYVCTRDEAHDCMQRIVASMRKDHEQRAKPSVPSTELEALRAENDELKRKLRSYAETIVLNAQRCHAIREGLMTSRKGSEDWKACMATLETMAGK